MKTVKETLYTWTIDSHIFHSYDYTDLERLTTEMYGQISKEKASWLKDSDRSALQIVFNIHKPLIASSVKIRAIVEFYNDTIATEYYLRWGKRND